MINLSVGTRPYVFVRGGSLQRSISAIYCSPSVQDFIHSYNWSKISEYNIPNCYHLRINLSKQLSISDSILSPEQVHSIIVKCRALRTVSYELSLNFIRAAEYSVLNFIRNENPTFFLGFSVDNYILDILYIYLKHHGIACLAVTCTPLSPHFILSTVRGELTSNPVSSYLPTYDQFKKILLSRHRNPRSNPSLLAAIPTSLKSFIKIPFYFYRHVYSRLFNDFSYEYYFSKSMIINSCPNIFSLFSDYKSLSDIHCLSSSKVAYIPLSVYPEATIDYWTNASFTGAYEDYIISIIDALIDRSYIVCLKAHPYFPFNIHQSILKYVRQRHHRLFMMHPSVNGLDMIELSSLIVSLSGTSAFQALLLDKDIIALDNTLYTKYLEPGFCDIALPANISLFPASINAKNLKEGMNAFIASHI